MQVELHVAGTLGPTGLSIYAEALIGWSPVTAPDEEGKRKPRKMFFTGDARHVVVPRSETQVKELTARVMDRLLGFAYWRQDVGLMVDRHGHLPGRLVGRVRVSARETDVEFAVRLPQPSGKAMKFVGGYAVVT